VAGLNITKLSMKSDKYIFKKKLNLRKKSKRRLFIESFLMFVSSLLIVYINYLIPNKSTLLQNVPTSLTKIFDLIIDMLLNLYDLLVVFFIFISLIISLMLFLGCLFRLFRIFKKTTKGLGY